ncbi:MAG: hypothetical protein IJR82_01110 [Bacilli bacterium]|nr:hypothetical protein [Bacilli bacterium]
MKNKIKYLMFGFLFLFVFSMRGHALIVDNDSYVKVSTSSTDRPTSVIEQSAEWVDERTVKYKLSVDINKMYETSNYININLIVYNISDSMSKAEITRYKAAMVNAVKAIQSENYYSRYIIMNEQEYLDYVEAGNSIAAILKYTRDGISMDDSFINEKPTSNQLIYSIDILDIKKLIPQKSFGESELYYSVIYINTFPNFSNAISLNNIEQSDIKDDTQMIENGEIVYGYLGSSVSSPICLKNRIYYLQYVADASGYTDENHVDYKNLQSKIRNSFYSSCSFLNYDISYIYNDKLFDVDINDITASEGHVNILEMQRDEPTDKRNYIYWDLGSRKSDSVHTLEVYLHLKDASEIGDDYCNSDNNCSVDENGIKKISMGGDVGNLKLSNRYTGPVSFSLINDAPSVKDKYTVYYRYDDAPCTIPENDRVSAQSYHPYSTVTIDQNDLYCPGYEFVGWKYPLGLDEQIYYMPKVGSTIFYNDMNLNQTVYYNDIKQINNDVFLMPNHDVVLVPIWRTVSIEKDFKSFRDINIMGNKQSIANNYSNEGFVLFGGFCWKMIDLSSDSKVTLLYYGEPDDYGTCNSNRTVHGGYNGKTSVNLDDEYYYGTGYTYDNIHGKFSLKGDIVKSDWNETTANNLIGKYTCKSNISFKTCDEMYYIMDYNSESSAYATVLNNSVPYNAIGVSDFNSSDDSIAYGKYAYGTPYKSKVLDMLSRKDILQKIDYSGDYYYGDDIVYSNDYYTLSNLNLINEVNNIENLIGKYTFFKNDSDYMDDEVYYIAGVDDSYIYYLQLYDGETKDDIEKTYYLSKNYEIDNSTGIISLNEPIAVKNTEWFTNTLRIEQGSSDNYVVCEGATSCNNYFNVYLKSNSELGYFKNILFGDSFTYDSNTGEYTLVNPQRILYVNYNLESNSMNDNNSQKYTCYGSETSCSTLYYVKESYPAHANSLELRDGIDEVQALSVMNKPMYDSSIKKVVDAWYLNNLADYDDLIDNIWVTNDGEDHSGETTFYPISIIGYSSISNLSQKNYLKIGYDTWIGNEQLLAQENFVKAFAVYINSYNELMLNPIDSVTSLKLVRPIIVLSPRVEGTLENWIFKVDDGYEY